MDEYHELLVKRILDAITAERSRQLEFGMAPGDRDFAAAIASTAMEGTIQAAYHRDLLGEALCKVLIADNVIRPELTYEDVGGPQLLLAAQDYTGHRAGEELHAGN